MKLLLPSTVLLLMVFVGMSLNWTQFLANLRRLTLATWGKLLLATFIIPPILALALGSLLPLDRGALIGLFLIAVAPGVSHSYHESTAHRRGGMALRAQYLGVTG
jgi:predicted Na+-dependent transporter